MAFLPQNPLFLLDETEKTANSALNAEKKLAKRSGIKQSLQLRHFVNLGRAEPLIPKLYGRGFAFCVPVDFWLYRPITGLKSIISSNSLKNCLEYPQGGPPPRGFIIGALSDAAQFL